MKVAFRASFAKDLRKAKDRTLNKRVAEIIEEVERADNLHEIGNLKALRSATGYHRIRVGDYRLGLIVEGNQVTFVRFLHRKDIYRYFP